MSDKLARLQQALAHWQLDAVLLTRRDNIAADRRGQLCSGSRRDWRCQPADWPRQRAAAGTGQ